MKLIRWNSNTETSNQPRSMGKKQFFRWLRAWDVFSHFFAAKTLWPAHSLVNPNMGLLASPGQEDLSGSVATNAPSPQWVRWQAPMDGPTPSLTRVSPQVPREGIPATAGVVTQVTLEGFFTWVQLYVAQEVALLCKGGSALIALERAFSYGEKEKVRENKKPCAATRERFQWESCFLTAALWLPPAAGLI